MTQGQTTESRVSVDLLLDQARARTGLEDLAIPGSPHRPGWYGESSAVFPATTNGIHSATAPFPRSRWHPCLPLRGALGQAGFRR